MRVRGFLVLAVLSSAGLVAGCAPRRPAEPDGRAAALAAVNELRAARAKVPGTYRADFAAKWWNAEDGNWTWSGTLNATGRDWQASSDLRLAGAAYAHVESVQSGEARYHKQTGHINFAQWQRVQGDSLGNYYWKLVYDPDSKAVTKQEVYHMPEVDPLLYLDIEYAERITRTDLPGGGHRYEVPGSEWSPAEPLQQHFKNVGIAGMKLVVDVGGDGLPARVEFLSDGSVRMWQISVTMTLRDIGAAVTVSAPPSDQVVPGRLP